MQELTPTTATSTSLPIRSSLTSADQRLGLSCATTQSGSGLSCAAAGLTAPQPWRLCPDSATQFRPLTDVELLPEYAKMVWEVYCDEKHASSYLEQVACASHNSATFLWDTDVDACCT